MFVAKKIVSALVYPLLLGLLLVVLGLLFVQPRWRPARRLALLGVGLIVVAALPVTATLAARTLEWGQHPVDVSAAGAHASAIVVLSGGSFSGTGAGPWEDLNGPSIKRVLEGVRLKRALPELPLILSGGVPATELELELDSLDTHDQARLLAQRLGNAPFYLVTSATHMPRSLGLFRHRGLRPVPAPTDFLDNGIAWRAFDTWLPNAQALAVTTRSVHEWYGLLWGRLRDQL